MVPCYYIICFGCLMGFNMHFYIIFGTNLLTGGPVQIAVFLPISVFHRKGISNGVQTEWNLRDACFWNKRSPGDLEWTSRKQRGRRARPGGVGAPPPSWAPRGSTDLLLSPIYILIPWNLRGEPWNTFTTTATFFTREIPSWGLFRRSAGGGIDHGGLLHQHHSLSDDVWVVYHRPSGPWLLARWLLLSLWFSIQSSHRCSWRSIWCNYFCGVFAEIHELWVYD